MIILMQVIGHLIHIGYNESDIREFFRQTQNQNSRDVFESIGLIISDRQIERLEKALPKFESALAVELMKGEAA